MEWSKQLIKRSGAFLYGAATSVRNKLYDHELLRSYKSSLPVVSVGNLTVGGNGKTPLIIFLAEQFKLRGWSPVVLTRGYGGKLKGPHNISKNEN